MSHFLYIPLIIFLVVFYPLNQKKAETNYTIQVSSNTDNLIMECESGCNWKTLKIPIQTGDQIAISNTGSATFFDFTDFDKDKEGVFLFYISLDGNTYKLKSFVGSRWEELTFELTMADMGILTDKGIQVRSGEN